MPCPICGPSALAPLWSCGAFAFARCRSCGLVQQDPQPEPAAVAARYDEAYLRYEEERQYAFRDLELLALRDLRLAEAARPLFGRARSEGRKPRALDVGCATGALLAALRDEGWEPQGVEISGPLAAYGSSRHGLAIHGGTLESAAFPAASFELVHASHLIEHLNDPASFLAEVGRVLAPDGLLVVTTPNAEGFQARLLGAQWRSAIYDHLYLFSPRTLSSLMSARGLEIGRLATWGGWARGLSPAFVKKPLDLLAKRLGFGDVMAVLARKAVY